MQNNRPEKDQYYLSIAAQVASRSTCLRRQYGAVIVKDDRIISTGYNGARLASPQPCLMCSRAIKNAQIAKVVTA